MKSTQEITRDVQELGRWIPALREQVSHVIVGQKYLVDRLLLGLLANGHILLEGVPGLAKTLTVKTMAAAIQTGFQRLQFTPDLLPADLIGPLIYNPRTNLSPLRPVSGSGHTKPDRAGGNVSTSRSAARSLHVQIEHWLSGKIRGTHDPGLDGNIRARFARQCGDRAATNHRFSWPSEPDLHRRPGERLHCRCCLGDARTGFLQFASRRIDSLRRIAAGHDLSRARRPRSRVFERPRLRHAARCKKHRTGCLAASYHC